ncbi:nicotinate phosphoribosyltransferase [Paenibacillus sp.]|uniref:nicotinate phosphoribosyltransferase n=1 Tax=Paenibacillus sp. TaxID=58172 RepID=UPI002D4BCEE9|nr:nicotinate phosphoribosyltransferase [Paenibacillus sp.]HZG87734.1 nicotinate phosphoribosyltransferase [Paenibacillus sp.]
MNGGALALHMDKYEVNMAYAHWLHGTHRKRAVFELYFRKLPFGNGFAVFAGLERVIDYLSTLRFDEEDIRYLREQEEAYREPFLDELRRFRFAGDLFAAQEGTIVFPNEPLLRVEASVFEAQMIETALLNFVNFQTLIATKAARIKRTSPGDNFLEFGSRRAQEADAAIWGARAAYIAGFDATSNLLAGKRFGIPTAGTHAHSWVQAHDSELEAFEKYAEALPDQVTLLVDTYDTLSLGVPHAIRIAQRLEARGKRMRAIRIDSGDLAAQAKAARAMLDEAGLGYVRIVASNDLDEHVILHLKAQGAPIDSWGVGTKLITGGEESALGGVYKLVARETDDGWQPVIKISGNAEKTVTPGAKTAYRLIRADTGRAAADALAFPSEDDVRGAKATVFVDPSDPLQRRELERYEAVPLLTQVVARGELREEGLPDLGRIREHHAAQLRLFAPEHLRALNPEPYPVWLSEDVWKLKTDMIRRYRSSRA